MSKFFSEGGWTVNCVDIDCELMVKVTVTGAGAVTCPACTLIDVWAKPPGI